MASMEVYERNNMYGQTVYDFVGEPDQLIGTIDLPDKVERRLDAADMPYPYYDGEHPAPLRAQMTGKGLMLTDMPCREPRWFPVKFHPNK